MTVNIKIGDFCTLLACGLGHDVEVGDFSTISSWCNIMGHVKIGNRVFMGGNCSAAPNAVIEVDTLKETKIPAQWDLQSCIDYAKEQNTFSTSSFFPISR